MAVTVGVIQVAFDGDGAGAEDLTWGQLGIWRRTRQTGRTMNIVLTLPLDDGTPLVELVGMLRFLVSRHPALRTRLRFDTDPKGDKPRPRQVVVSSGEVPLHVVDVDDERGDPAAAAEELHSRYEIERFDYENEFPVRMGVVQRWGKPAYLVIGYSHVLLDGAGIRALGRDVRHFDRAGGARGAATAPPPPAPSVLEVARAQASPAGRRLSARAVRHWAVQLDRLAAWQPPEPPRRREPRYWELVGYSPAMELAMRVVAARTGIGTTHVLMAAYSVAVARVFKRDPSVAQIVVGNRFRPGFADLASQVSQDGICVVDVADADFDEVVARAEKAVTGASFAAYYDPDERDRMLTEAAERRGGRLDIEWHVNDRRDKGGAGAGDDQRAAPVPRAADVARVLPLSRWYWGRKASVFDGALYLQVDSEPVLEERLGPDDVSPAVYLQIWTDTCSFQVTQVETFAREMEAVVVAAALAPEPGRPETLT
ncbi:MAG: condensation protein [Catenulisporales bacterium]|nr:condensation protein [Catenulisporales bacterium]